MSSRSQQGSFSMHYLITGGCGFIGSHLAERLLEAGHKVVVLDDLSTGFHANVAHLEDNSNFQLIIGSVLDSALVEDLVRACDGVYHLASAVGVRLIMEQPVETIETIVEGTQRVLKYASRYRKRTLLTSTSEVYGKSKDTPFREDGDRLEGPTTKHRWAYACAKALDEFLALAHWKESRLPVTVVRLFNTVGPRQTGQYGMVVPTFIKNAMTGQPLLVHGTGLQSRCFAHVHDIVSALSTLIETQDAYGEVINLGSTEEISMYKLAEKIVKHTSSASKIECIPYSAAYGEGFEDMLRRVPCIEKAHNLIGWEPKLSLDDIIGDVVADISVTRAA
jgi:UDP-glucose 4-epimerase